MPLAVWDWIPVHEYLPETALSPTRDNELFYCGVRAHVHKARELLITNNLYRDSFLSYCSSWWSHHDSLSAWVCFDRVQTISFVCIDCAAIGQTCRKPCASVISTEVAAISPAVSLLNCPTLAWSSDPGRPRWLIYWSTDSYHESKYFPNQPKPSKLFRTWENNPSISQFLAACETH